MPLAEPVLFSRHSLLNCAAAEKAVQFNTVLSIIPVTAGVKVGLKGTPFSIFHISFLAIFPFIEEFKEMEGIAGVHLMAIEWVHNVPDQKIQNALNFAALIPINIL